MRKSGAQLERKVWIRTKARGRRQFILRQMMAVAVIVLVVAFGIDLLDHHGFSLALILINVLVLLPIALLGGYFEGRWKWKDFEKRFPEDRLSPLQ